ncbi:MAG: insulinase family protein [Ancrocorticia sp.]|nr:insulinase family protein [Ancrocorticia sp.]
MSDIPLLLDPQAGSVSLTEEGRTFRRSILPGGIRLLTEFVPYQRSASIGFWVGTGSRDEGAQTRGSTHFLEHLLFKGTHTRDARQIAERIDFLGGGFNAATAKQYTCYYGHVFDDDVAAGVELLSDMVMNSRLTPEDMEMERGVILEELAMYNDDASDVAQETIPTQVFTDHPLALPVGGTKESVAQLTHHNLVHHYGANYRSQELVITAAGNIDHAALGDMIVAQAARFGWNTEEGQLPEPRRRTREIAYAPGSSRFELRNVEQAVVVVGMPGLGLFDERRPALFALNAILGGGTSSRLFQQIREQRGLAYSTYSYPVMFPEGGMFGLYAGCAPHNAADVAGLLGDTLDDLAHSGVTADEVESAYRRVRADVVFDAERLSSHMNRLGQAELIRGTYLTQAETLARSRAVTAGEVTELARELAAGPRSLCIVGPSETRR